ncbi:MAG: TetR family transcriptional regulator [Rhizobiales bacterium]|nr:TetR family transcriptional regulator [Hyphomicrobiales bacterium]
MSEVVQDNSKSPVVRAAAETTPDSAPAPTGGSKRKLESRRKLLAAAKKLFIERGYHETRPQDISREAGVGHGTFYLHFDDKLDCFLAFAEEATLALQDILKEPSEQDLPLEESILEIIHRIFGYVESHPGLLAAAMVDIDVITTNDSKGRKMLVDQWAESWTDRISNWERRGLVMPGLDKVLTGYMIVGAMKHGGGYAFRDGLDKDRVAREITRLIVRAIEVN